MLKKICDKKVKNITYELMHFEGDNKYVIYKWDDKIIKNDQAYRVPEEAIFDNEKDAKKYLNKL